MLQTPTASSKLYAPKTPIKPVTRSPDKPVKPGPLVQAAPGDSSDTTEISEEVRLSITSLFCCGLLMFVSTIHLFCSYKRCCWYKQAITLTPVQQSKFNNDAPDQNKTGTAKKQMAIKVCFLFLNSLSFKMYF